MNTPVDLDFLVAAQEIATLKARYCRFVDEHNWDGLTTLFAADGFVRILDVEGGTIADMRGPDIGQTIGDTLFGAATFHQISAPELELEAPDRATCIWTLEDHVWVTDTAPPELPSFHGWGRYHETYVRLDGQWLMESAILYRTKLELL